MLLCVYITTYQGTQSTTRDEQKSFPRWVCGTILCLKLEAYGTVLLFRAFQCEKGGGGGVGVLINLTNTRSVWIISSCVPYLKCNVENKRRHLIFFSDGTNILHVCTLHVCRTGVTLIYVLCHALRFAFIVYFIDNSTDFIHIHNEETINRYMYP